MGNARWEQVGGFEMRSKSSRTMSYIVVFACLGILAKTQDAQAQVKAQPAIERAEGKFLANRQRPKVRPIDPKVHRRILRFLNAARRPEDLMARPDAGGGEAGEHGHGLAVKDGNHNHGHLMEIELAKRVFEERQRISPLYGYQHIEQLLHIEGPRWAEIIEVFTFSFGRAVYGKWEILYSTPVPVAHAALLHTPDDMHAGRVLFLERAHYAQTWQTPLWNPEESDPTTAFSESPTPPTDNLYCSGHSFLSDGKLLVVGGGGEHHEVAVPNMAWVFDPSVKAWQFTRDRVIGSPTFGTRTTMLYGRWYPTVLTLGDGSGRILIVDGDPPQMEMYHEDTGGFSSVWGPGGMGDPDADRSFLGLYPGLHLLPSGQVFSTRTGHGSGTTDPAAYFRFSDVNTGEWTELTGAGEGDNRRRGMRPWC